MDYEIAIWNAVRLTFHNSNIMGCVVHLNQRVWYKIQELGLASDYVNDIGTRQLCKKLMSLVYLPESLIGDAFARIEALAVTPKLKELCKYFSDTWLEHSVWSVSDISVYNQPI